MLKKRVNLLEKLSNKTPHEDLLNQVNTLLKNDISHEKAISQRINSNSSTTDTTLKTRLLPYINKKDIFTHSQIKQICIEYRLRFLDSSLFKDDIPQEAIFKIKQLEKKAGVSLQDFKIIAPAALFKLKDPDKDPILFANLNDGTYLYIHKWGNDMIWYRKWLMWPFRKIENLLKLIVAFNAIAVFLMPSSWFDYGNPEAIFTHKMFLFLFMLIGTMSLSIFYGFAVDKNFTESEWDNKYLR